ncbi:MAG TPA: choice-of-anchor tandem repeat GloVer-containing protein, partial [Terriglobia bacterium]|nr:choice-of-anchor tandem repeat GloVer-containing protein [Terriglobia bacterium]
MTASRAVHVFFFCHICGLAQNPHPAFSTIYSFAGGSDGASPRVRLTVGSGGVLYGTTYGGGDDNVGTVFSLTPPVSPGGAWTHTMLHTFTIGDGAYPNSRLVPGRDGVLYGTTSSGGTSQFGTVFSMTAPASPGGTWTEAVLHSFGAVGYGAAPRGGLALGPMGVLYGATHYGGNMGLGAVFALQPPASPDGAWTESVVYSFQGGGVDGEIPYSSVTMGSGGILYGTTWSGGTSGFGTVYSLAPPAIPGGAWTETVLHSFAGGRDGQNPGVGVAIGADGVLYGSTNYGGGSNGGTIYSLTPSAGGWTEAVIHEFPRISGRYPAPGPVTIAPSGALYGTTQFGGASYCGT